MSTSHASLRTLAGLTLVIGLGALFAAPSAAQTRGDRRLLTTQVGGDPSIMVLLDTSGSMNWASTCTAEDIALGHCDFPCKDGSCATPRGGDDPASKFYQAKEALYQVITENPDAARIHWGVATLNQDRLAVGAKHWIYSVESVVGENGISLPPDLNELFAIGTQEVFGAITGSDPPFNFGCDRYQPGVDNSPGTCKVATTTLCAVTADCPAGDTCLPSTFPGYRTLHNMVDFEVGCYPNKFDAVAMNGTQKQAWPIEKLHRLPKGGVNGTSAVSYYARSTSGSSTTAIYRVTFRAAAAAFNYADTPTFDAKVDIATCPVVAAGGAGCTPIAGNLKVTYSRGGDTSFFFWEGVLNRHRSNKGVLDLTADSKRAYFGGYPDRNVDPFDSLTANPATLGADNVFWASDTYAADTCRGWDPSGTSYPSNVYAEPPNLTGVDTDPFNSGLYDYNLRFPDDGYTFDLTGTVWEGWQFAMLRGDVIPLDWQDNNYDRILTRLNPKHPTVDSDSFRISPYFTDTYGAGEGFLRLKDENERPMISHGLSPLAGWFSFARSWYTGCGNPGQCDNLGWKDIRAYFDPDANCQKTYVLMLTDGDETCDNNEDSFNLYASESLFPDGFQSNADQCRYRASFQAQEDVETLVIGFGVEDQNKLQCAGTPVVFVYNKEELLTVLREFIARVLEEAASFASAAVPTVQANVLDKIYLSSFIPVNGMAVWPGRLDAFLKPLPLDPTTGLPDRSADCVVGQQAQCFAWDAGDSQVGWNVDGPPDYDPDGLLVQAPLPSDVIRWNNDTLQIGDRENERRVFYGRPDDADDLAHRRYFQYPTGDTEWLEYEFIWNISDPTDPLDAPLSAFRKDVISDIIEFTLEEKQAEIGKTCTAGANAKIGNSCSTNVDCDSNAGGDGVCTPDARIQYVMGDIFHSNPIVINPPADFDLFTKDLYWNTPLCGQNLDTTRARGEQISYSWYSNKNICRRVMVAVGSNDGQAHVFDGGIIRDVTPDDPTTSAVDEEVKADCLLNVPVDSASFLAGLYDDDGLAGDYDSGTGRELFSFIPQQMMPLVKELSEADELTTQYGIDGTLRAVDVFVDPVPTAGVPTCTERTWRTLLLGNYREGGSGVFALDITQPDLIEDATNQPVPLVDTPEYVPSCIDGGSGCDEFCIAGDLSCAALPFPALRWEFRDFDALGQPADDDLNGVADLAESWSRPLVFRHPACTANCDDDANAQIEDRWLAVFGGGLSENPTNDASESAGNWLYMVDIETGEVLYKRGGNGVITTSPIVGAIPSDITGVDRDTDGIVDTLYFGTTAGYVYKVILGDEAWELDPVSGLLVDPALDPGLYDPFQVFTTGGRPIYLEINVIYVPAKSANALLFGTGNRWNLWSDQSLTGRFYALLDTGWEDGLDAVSGIRDGISDDGLLDENSYKAVDPVSGAAIPRLLLDGDGSTLPGWYFPLLGGEKLITEPFTLAGVSFFTIYSPLLVENADGSCSLGGESKIFVVNSVTTEGYAIQAGSTDRTRYTTTNVFTTQPFVEPSSTKNVPTSSSSANADRWTTELAEINADLRKLFPAGARFANYTLDIKTIRQDTGLVFIAPVPVAIEPHNWKEF